MEHSVKTGTFKNDAGDTVILNYHTATSKAYEEAGYKLAENSEDLTAAAMTAAQVLTEPLQTDLTPASENARSRDDQDEPADPSAVAYPAGQLPREVDPAADQADGPDPISDKTMQDSQPDGDGGTVPLTESYDTPPTPDRNPSPERREAMREANAEAGIVDERGVHEHQEGESAAGGEAKTLGEVPVPGDLKAENVVKAEQGANKDVKSQGTTRPTARSRVKD